MTKILRRNKHIQRTWTLNLQYVFVARNKEWGIVCYNCFRHCSHAHHTVWRIQGLPTTCGTIVFLCVCMPRDIVSVINWLFCGSYNCTLLFCPFFIFVFPLLFFKAVLIANSSTWYHARRAQVCSKGPYSEVARDGSPPVCASPRFSCRVLWYVCSPFLRQHIASWYSILCYMLSIRVVYIYGCRCVLVCCLSLLIACRCTFVLVMLALWACGIIYVIFCFSESRFIVFTRLCARACMQSLQ